MQKIPVVIEGDWMELMVVEAETPEAALVQVANEYIEAIRGSGPTLRLDPEGVKGKFTPNRTLEVQTLRNGQWMRESVWTVPDGKID